SSYAICFGAALIASAVLDFQIAARPDAAFRNLFRFLGMFGAVIGALTIYVYGIGGPAQPIWADGLALTILLSGIPASAVLEYWILRRDFLEIGSQKNLVYALSAAFLALLYLTLVRRVSGWLEPVVPPEATASTLLFILVVFFEPLERGIGRAVQRTFKRRFDRLQRLLAELQEKARHGDVLQFTQFVERRVKEEFGLSVVRLTVLGSGEFKPLSSPGGLGHVASSRLVRNGEQTGLIEAASTGAVLTGEVTAALDFLAEQLPALIDLCRLIQDKVELERALAERERMAMLGQMAASVSHNLRNPLSSMKTIIQVQLESRELPEAVREDLLLILAELDRLSSKLTQLLRYSRSPVAASRADETAAGGEIIKEILNVLRRDAEQRGVSIECEAFGDATRVRGSEEALSDIFANLILNAVESQPAGGRIDIGAHRKNGCWIVEIRDAGPGISANVRERIFQPFFTTKANGTGLGLAIVTRRLGEIGGTIEIESPVSEGRGTKFTVTLPLATS
ncbi:MAG TPA: ATP-binding protein, partial [Candidatus Acidoferrales bacterium]|nr:ATP-binding protein [Candidatus Acidoferrales bacterium]